MRKISLLFLLVSNSLLGQIYSGKVLEGTTKIPIEFVNIGIVGKNVGTTSDMSGSYKIDIGSGLDNDTILFSCVGYLPYAIKTSEYKKLNNWNIQLKKKTYEIDEVVINPKKFIRQILGVKSKSKRMQAGFKDNKLGYELGLLLKVKKTAFLEKVDISIAVCTYDSIFYRLNIYRVRDKKRFENILQKPIYISLPNEKVAEKISIDLKSQNIVVDGDFLITLEHVKDLGQGSLLFSAALLKKTYYRKTSQGIWEKVPIGIGISVTAQVEK
ncbi:MAG: carboxypeptidase-like regulatory domain-containing protein [Bacteroidota bacterium]